MMRRYVMVMVVLAAMGLAGCKTVSIEFSVLAADDVDASRLDCLDAAAGAEAVGRDTQYILIGLLPLTGPATVGDAFDKACAETGGNCMVNGTLYEFAWPIIPTILDAVGYEIKGTVLKVPSKP